MVTRNNNKFETSTYRKETFSGLGTSYFSFTPFIYKLNCLKTLIYRGYNVSSNFFSMHSEFEFLRIFFNNNELLPTSLIFSQIKKFLHNKNLNIVNNPVQTSDLTYFVSFPFFGHQSDNLKSELNKVFHKYFPSLNVRLIFTNKSTIGSFFPYKDKLPYEMRFSLIYEFSCAPRPVRIDI